jgi:hypothetical protein
MAAEPNNTNIAADAVVTAAAIGKLSAADRANYAAAARKYANTAPTSQNGAFWLNFATLIEASTSTSSAAWVAAEAATKAAALSVSASTQRALLAWVPGLTPKVQAASKPQLPTWVWLAAAGLGLYAWKGR